MPAIGCANTGPAGHRGFPAGFEMRDFQLHLYNHGKEIATDVSPKRVLLTREEAFLYARMQYLGSHKDGTVPA